MIGSSLKISVDKRMETINSDGNLKMAKIITNVNKGHKHWKGNSLENQV